MIQMKQQMARTRWNKYMSKIVQLFDTACQLTNFMSQPGQIKTAKTDLDELSARISKADSKAEVASLLVDMSWVR